MEIEKLKELVSQPEELLKQVDGMKFVRPEGAEKFHPEQHDVMDVVERPNRKAGNTTIDVHRIASATQQEILDWSVDMALSGGVGIDSTIRDGVPTDQDLLDMVSKTLEDNKFDFIAERLERLKQQYMQVALIWYTVEADESYWQDIPTAKSVKNKWRCMIVSPEDGSELIAIRDRYNDMVGLVRLYKVKDGDKEIEKMDLYTDDVNYFYSKGEGGWIIEDTNIHNLGKGTFIYDEILRQEWQGQTAKLARREEIDSDSADENKVSAFPILGVSGKVKVLNNATPNKESTDNTLKMLEMEPGSSAEYIETRGSEERLQTERENLLNDIYRETATPQINFNDISGDLPGVTIEMLMLPATNKARRKHRGEIGIFHQRNLNFLKAGLIKICPGLKPSAGLVIKPKFTIQLPRNKKEEREMVVRSYLAGLISLPVAIRELGYVTDIDTEVEEILKEKASALENDNAKPPTEE